MLWRSFPQNIKNESNRIKNRVRFPGNNSPFLLLCCCEITIAYRPTTIRRVVFEFTDEQRNVNEAGETSIVHWNDPSLWKYQINISVDHLRQRLEGIVTNEDGMMLTSNNSTG